jgi:hypothetical protein
MLGTSTSVGNHITHEHLTYVQELEAAVRYKVWRSNKDKSLHLLCREGSENFEALPASIRGLGPWQGSREGEFTDLRLPLRLLLAEQGFTVVHAHVGTLTK